MAGGLHFMVEAQLHRHVGDLRSWVGRVRSARRAEDALRLAYYRPSSGALMASVRRLVLADEQRASAEVERLLRTRLEALSDVSECARCVQIAMRLIWAPAVASWAREMGVAMQADRRKAGRS